MFGFSFYPGFISVASRTALLATFLLGTIAGNAQIGGFTAANGPFLLENAEDLDTTAGGVLRAWVPDNGAGSPFEVIEPTTASLGLTLAPGQSPLGALNFKPREKFGFVSWSCGVPMPGVAGASTLTNPGNITSFDKLTFLACSDTVSTDPLRQVMLECYPGVSDVYPKIIWRYTMPLSKTFAPISLNLRTPTMITDNPGGYTVEQLLAQTRFLTWYFYSGPELNNATLRFYMDDIRLEGASHARDWTLFE